MNDKTLSNQDVYDISEYLTYKIKDYMERFEDFGTYLAFEDFIRDQLASDLKHKYTKYQIEEAFEDERLLIIVDFYTQDASEFDSIH